MLTLLNLNPALPELWVLCMACISLLVGVFAKQRAAQIVYSLVQITLIVAAILTWQDYGQATQYAFNNMFVLDRLACFAKLIVYVLSFFAFIYARTYIRHREIAQPEYYILGLFSILGMMLMISAQHFISFYLSLELLSLPLYALVALRRNAGNCAEAAMKYFVMGALASGMLLYGLSLWYGASKTLYFSEFATILNHLPADQNLLVALGLVFVLAGFAFKLGAAPFHMWAPDVYQGAPTSVTLFIGSAPKVAILIVIFRFLTQMLPSLQHDWQQLLMIIAVASMAIGNIAAIVQSNVKRMLAYSSIAHMGYMSLGLIANTAAGNSAALLYMAAYALMTLGGFAVLTILSAQGEEVEQLEDLRGLNTRDPWLAFMMLLIMFSMAGIPPMLGFFIKLGVLEVLIAAGYVWLAALALIFSIIGAYYYLRVVKSMYFEAAENPSLVSHIMDSRIAIAINGLAILLLGIFPSELVTLCRQVFQV